MMRRFALAALLFMSIGGAFAQQNGLPNINLPANSVIGNNLSVPSTANAIPFAQLQTLLNASGVFPLSVSGTSVIAAGAKCDGSTDDTVAIQSAINLLPSDGGIIVFPQGQNCKISSTLSIGNGTASTVSTRRGVIIHGAGVPGATGAPFFNGYPAIAGPKLTWAGGSAPMINIAGPLKGWGIQGLALDCASTATVGISVVSAGYGDNSNLAITNCQSAGISSTSNPLGGYSGVVNVDSIRNNWYNLDIIVPAVAGAKGILFDGDAGGTSNTDYNTVTNAFIRMAGGSLANIGIDLAVSDSNVFNSINISGGGSSSFNVYLDYSRNGTFPLGNAFFGIDSNGSGTQWNNNGSPGAGARCNYVYGLMQSNGGTNPNIANLCTFFGGAWSTFTPALTCGSATFTLTSARFNQMGKTTSIELEFTISVIGSCTNIVSFNLPNTANSAGNLSGFETVNDKLAACHISSGGTSAACLYQAAAAFSLNDHLQISGVYEAQ